MQFNVGHSDPHVYQPAFISILRRRSVGEDRTSRNEMEPTFFSNYTHICTGIEKAGSL